jgi:hypothetical protein
MHPSDAANGRKRYTVKSGSTLDTGGWIDRYYENEESLAECKIVGFKFPVSEKNVRYVRLKAESLRVNPEWHRGVGQPCWIFCDEVVVR